MKTLLLICVILLSLESKAETGSAASFITGAKPISFVDGGAATLPPNVIQTLTAGKLSDELTFLLLLDMASSCTEHALRNFVPPANAPYVVAAAMFNEGVCQLFSCMQQSILMGQAAGGAEDGGSAAALTMAQGMQKSGACGKKGTAIDPKLVQSLQTQSKTPSEPAQ